MKNLVNKIINFIRRVFFVPIPHIDKYESGIFKKIDMTRLYPTFQIKRKTIRFNDQKLYCKTIRIRNREDGNHDIYVEYFLITITNTYTEKKLRKQWFLNCDSVPDENNMRHLHGEPIRIGETGEIYKDQNGNPLVSYSVYVMPGMPGYDDFGTERCIPKISREAVEHHE